MSDQASLETIETLELILAVDTARAAGDPFKLPNAGPTTLRPLVQARASALKAACGATALASGDEAGAQMAFRGAVDLLERCHRAGYRWLAGYLPDFIPDLGTGMGVYMSDAVREQLLTAYGFEGGIVGIFTDERVLDMARQAPIAAGVAVANTSWHYPADMLVFIAAQLAIADTAQMLATGGTTSTAIDTRNAARDAGEDVVGRVRFHYCGASDVQDRTPELRKIGMQPRRLPGDAQPGDLPLAPGAVTHDAADRTLTVAALPAHATSIRAFRQVSGGPVVLVGTSATGTVSYVAASPLTPGASHTVWLVGHNSEGDGPKSQVFTFTA